jgi:hypothetical protein
MKTCNSAKIKKFSKVGSIMNIYLKQNGWRSARNCEGWNDFFRMLNRKSVSEVRKDATKISTMMYNISVNWLHHGKRKQVPKVMALGLVLDVCDEVDRLNSIV